MKNKTHWYRIHSTRDPLHFYAGETTLPLEKKLLTFLKGKQYCPEILEWRKQEKQYLKIEEVVSSEVTLPEGRYQYLQWVDSLDKGVIVYSGFSTIFQHDKEIAERRSQKEIFEEWMIKMKARHEFVQDRLKKGLPYLAAE